MVILFVPVAILGGQLLYLYTHKEFRPDEFKCALVREEVVEVSLLSEPEKEQIQKILSQPFTFLGLGKQMTAYESQDHQYVLKFFNPRSRIKEKWFHDYKRIKSLCTLKWFSSAHFNRRERLLKLFHRHAIAFKEIPAEAALVYVHLNRLTALDQSVDIADRDGTRFLVHLKDVPFVLQRKVELAGAHLAQLASQNDQAGLQEALDQIRQLFVIRARKGITDRIQTLHNNYGFLDGKAIQIDVGRISLSKEVMANPEVEVEKIMSTICEANPSFLSKPLFSREQPF